jgi:hypothetical protein
MDINRKGREGRNEFFVKSRSVAREPYSREDFQFAKAAALMNWKSLEDDSDPSPAGRDSGFQKKPQNQRFGIFKSRCAKNS